MKKSTVIVMTIGLFTGSLFANENKSFSNKIKKLLDLIKPKKPKNISITIGWSLVKSRSIKDAENIINDFKSITLFSKVE